MAVTKKRLNQIFGGEATHVWGTEAQGVAFPDEKKPEVAFIGRSNVGKSTMINTLLNRHKLARTSQRPGATKAVHFYDIGGIFNLVDLPGYGYAKMSKTLSAQLAELIYTYFTSRRHLKKAYVLIDSRRGVKEVDREILNVLEEAGVPTQLIFTKGDKAKAVERDKALADALEEFKNSALVDANIIGTSSETKYGIDDVRHSILEACGIHQ